MHNRDRLGNRNWTGSGFVRLLLAGLCLLALQPARAATLELGQEAIVSPVYLAPYIEMYVGTDPPNDTRAAQTLPATDFAPVGRASPLRPLDTGWFRFSIYNNSSRQRSLVLDFDQALFSRVEWYGESTSTSRYVLTGQDYPHTSRDIDYNFFAFRLDIPPGETLTANFAIYTPFATLFLPRLVESEQFVSAVTFHSQFTGAVVGMLYSVCFFMLLYLMRIRKVGLAHAMFGFSLCCLLSVLYISGAVQRWLPDTEFPLRDAAYIVIHGLQGVTFCWVLRGFYQTERHYRFLDKTLVTVAVLELLLFPLLPWVDMRYLILSLVGFNSLLMLVSLPLGVMAMLRRSAETYLFSAGLLLFILMAMMSSLGAFGIVPVSFITRYGYELGLTLQVDFLFLAVVSQIFVAQQEKLAYEAEMIHLNADIKARSEFADKVTHDLKSPLTAVLGAEQLLRGETDERKRVHYLDIIHASSRMVATMIEDMLSYSRMKHGSFNLQWAPLSLPALLQEVYASVDTLPRAAGVTLSLVVDNAIPAVLKGDAMRVSQLLTNLMTNAIKFTEQGEVALHAEVAEAREADVWIRFTVADTGIGMAPAFIQQAFEPYTREESRVGNLAGFGLGLAICRQLVELMGGSIAVASETGKGTQFTVLLPFPR